MKIQKTEYYDVETKVASREELRHDDGGYMLRFDRQRDANMFVALYQELSTQIASSDGAKMRELDVLFAARCLVDIVNMQLDKVKS